MLRRATVLAVLALPALLALAAAVTGCRAAPDQYVVASTISEALPESQWNPDELGRDLEATALENYLQLALGNMEAYADSVAREREVALIGIGPKDVVVGINPPGLIRDRRPFRDRRHCSFGERNNEPCLRFQSKNLDVHVYGDGSVGWISDELSYRVPNEGREAAIPVRLTAVFVRDIDRWVLVLEHMSYALPRSEILAMAERGELEPPMPIKSAFQDARQARLLKVYVQREHNANEQTRARAARQRTSTDGDTAPDTKLDAPSTTGDEPADDEDDQQANVDDQALFALLPGTRQEYRGAQTYGAPSLAQLFTWPGGAPARVLVGDYRIGKSPNRRVAWMVANLSVAVTTPSGRELSIGLRGTYLFAKSGRLWKLVQSHVSVPVAESRLAERFFGAPATRPAEDRAIAQSPRE